MDLASIVSILAYVLTGIALYSMASRYGARNPWLAWIPVGTEYTLGLIAEKDLVLEGQKRRSYRKILMGLSIAMYSLVAVIVTLGIYLLVVLFVGMGWEIGALSMSFLEEWIESFVEGGTAWLQVKEIMQGVMAVVAVAIVASLALVVIAIIYTVYYYMALWHVYRLYEEKSANLLLVASIFGPSLISMLGGQLLPLLGNLVVPGLLMYLCFRKKDAPGEPSPAQETQSEGGSAPVQESQSGDDSSSAQENQDAGGSLDV